MSKIYLRLSSHTLQAYRNWVCLPYAWCTQQRSYSIRRSGDKRHTTKLFAVCFVGHTAKKKQQTVRGAVTGTGGSDRARGGQLWCVPCRKHTTKFESLPCAGQKGTRQRMDTLPCAMTWHMTKCYPEWPEMVTLLCALFIAYGELTKQLLFLLFFRV